MLMLSCLDVAYAGSSAVAACVTFAEWRSSTPAHQIVRRFSDVAPYEPGNFYRRELPCLVATLEQLPERPELVIVDGYVWLGAGRPGLGVRLFDVLGRSTPVVGVAKSPFPGAPGVEVLRGGSRTPLYVTAAGIDVVEAAENVRQMSGPYRLPAMLKLADQLCRASQVSGSAG